MVKSKEVLDFSFQNISGQKLPRGFKERARKIIRKIEKVTGDKVGEISLVMVRASRMRQLNSIYRHKNKVTDVLSFTYKAAPISGEIIICLSQAQQQAKHFGSTLNNELDFLLVHGCLHLLGHDHIRLNDKKKMDSMSDKILGKSRIGQKIYGKK